MESSSNRRDFIKATAAIGLAGASEASAQPVKTAQVRQAGAPAHRPLTANPEVKIGFLHSTNFESDLEDAFLEGLRSSRKFEGDPKRPIDPTQTTRVRIKKRIHNGNYGGSDIDDLNKLGKSLHDKAVKLIVATGGLVSGRAVWSAADPAGTTTPPKIFAIIGGADSTMTSSVVAWNLDSVANNKNRINALTSQFSIQSDAVCLLYNSAATMSGNEFDDWTGGGFRNAYNAGHNEEIDFATAIADAANPGDDKPKATALVVSADPFFFNQRGRIITEARQHGLKVCYPNKEFWASTADVRGTADPNSIGYGPSLVDVYKDVGLKAAAYLTDVSTTITPDPTVLKSIQYGP